MKAKLTRKLLIDLTLNSSETFMFSKGGKHKMTLSIKELNLNELYEYPDDEIEISVQMEKK